MAYQSKNPKLTSTLFSDQGSDIATPPSGVHGLYAKSAGLYFINSAGSVAQLSLANNPQATLMLTVGNGFGSINTRVRRWTTATLNTGSAYTYADSATLGGTVTINEAGVYGFTASDKSTSASATMAITLNATTQLTSGTMADFITAHPDLVVAYMEIPVVSTYVSMAGFCQCAVNDVIRLQNENSLTGSDQRAFLRIVQLSKF